MLTIALRIRTVKISLSTSLLIPTNLSSINQNTSKGTKTKYSLKKFYKENDENNNHSNSDDQTIDNIHKKMIMANPNIYHNYHHQKC